MIDLKTLREIIRKNYGNDELTLEHRVEWLELAIEKLLDAQLNETPKPKEPTDITIAKVKTLYYIREYVYKGTTLEQFLVTLEDDSKFYMDKHKGSQPQIENGDVISFKIDGDKLREVRVLYNV